MVYISALAPDAGGTTAQQYEGFPGPSEFVIDTHARTHARTRTASVSSIRKFLSEFAADISDAEAAFLRDVQVPINISAFETRLDHAAWRSRPSWAIIADDDQAFGAGMLQHMARRIGATITEGQGSHAVFMSQAKAVAAVIDQVRPRDRSSQRADSPM